MGDFARKSLSLLHEIENTFELEEDTTFPVCFGWTCVSYSFAADEPWYRNAAVCCRRVDSQL